jgi:hypothetical protein
MIGINPLMNAQTAFNLLTPFSLIFFLLIGVWYVLPRLYKEDIYGAITPLLLFSTLRYLALAFIVPGLSNGFEGTVIAHPAAYGDLAVSTIALVAAVASRWKLKVGIALAWAYAILGALDFVNAKSLGSESDRMTHIGALWPITLVGGPAFMVAILLLFIVLIRHQRARRSSLV